MKSNDNYLKTNYAEEYLKSGKWPEDIQIPKSTDVLKADGSVDWSQVPDGGYVLDKSGKAIKEVYNPEIGEIIDRYGPPNGRYTSPVVDGKPYAYDQRSLPYIEDTSKYYQYEVVDDFSNIEKAVSNCKDIKLKSKIEAYVKKYYHNDYSKVVPKKRKYFRRIWINW